jgi:hypothetical protein
MQLGNGRSKDKIPAHILIKQGIRVAGMTLADFAFLSFVFCLLSFIFCLCPSVPLCLCASVPFSLASSFRLHGEYTIPVGAGSLGRIGFTPADVRFGRSVERFQFQHFAEIFNGHLPILG